MKYRGNQTNMWDAWFLNVEGCIHAFHLQLPRKECTLPPEECQAVSHIYCILSKRKRGTWSLLRGYFKEYQNKYTYFTWKYA